MDTVKQCGTDLPEKSERTFWPTPYTYLFFFRIFSHVDFDRVE